MKTHLFHSFVSLLFTVFLGLIGLGLVLLYKSPALVDGLFLHLGQHKELLLYWGLSLLTFSSFLFLLFYTLTKKSVYQVQLEDSLNITVENKILTRFLSDFFDQELEHKPIDFSLKAKGKKMEVIVDFSKIPLGQHEVLLEKIEPKMVQELNRLLGGSKQVTLSVLCK